MGTKQDLSIAIAGMEIGLAGIIISLIAPALTTFFNWTSARIGEKVVSIILLILSIIVLRLMFKLIKKQPIIKK